MYFVVNFLLDFSDSTCVAPILVGELAKCVDLIPFVRRFPILQTFAADPRS